MTIKTKKRKRKKNKNARSNKILFIKDIQDKLISNFTTSNETGRIFYTEQSCSKRAAGHSKMERCFISSLSDYKELVPIMSRVRINYLLHILPPC